MSIFSKLISANVADPIEAVGNAFDKLFTSDEERALASAAMERIRQKPHILQAEINKIEASHRSIFVAGWRPAIGWVCAAGLAFPFLVNPVLQWCTGTPGPEMPTDALTSLIYALLGLGSLRTVEKIGGKAK